MFAETATRFATPIDVPARHRLRQAAHAYPLDRWRALAELGLLSIAVPEGEGGLGGSRVDLAVVAQALGQANAPDPWLENGVLPLRLLAGARQDELRADVLTGEAVAAVAFAESGGRYALEPRSVRCEAAGGRVRLTGTKTFVASGMIADWFLVTARQNGSTRVVLVSADASGVTRRGYRVADGSEAAEVVFDVELPSDALLPAGTDGWHRAVADTRLLAAAEMVGLAGRLLDDTLAYAKERHQFGAPIGSFQAVQHRLVDCYAMLEQARSMLWHAAMADADAPGWAAEMAGAKAFVAERALHTGREAIQLHGGMGVTDELGVGHAVKRVLLLSRLFGDPDADLATYAEAA